GWLDAARAATERAAAETAEALAALETTARQLELEPHELEKVEERRFAPRAAARKHQMTVADLPGLRERMAAGLAEFETGAEGVDHLVRATDEARTRFIADAEEVSRGRTRAAARFAAGVAAELKPLLLDKARFRTVLA